MSDAGLRAPSGRTRVIDRIMRGVSGAAALVPLAMFAWLLLVLARSGLAASAQPESWPEFGSTVASSSLASALIVALGLGLALPLGVGAAIELSEFAGRGRWARSLEVNAACLAAVPTVVYGLVGLELFARGRDVGPLAGALTLAFVSTPLVLDAAAQALRAAAPAEREAGLALGATRAQILRVLVLPRALPGLLGSVVIGLARVFGEAASLIVVVGAAAKGSGSLDALPLRIFAWVDGAEAGAASACAILVAICIGLGGLGMVLRRESGRALAREVLP